MDARSDPSGRNLAASFPRSSSHQIGWPTVIVVAQPGCPRRQAHALRASAEGEAWARRIRGLRASASRCSHAELDAATTLDAGDPREFGGLCADLHRRLPGLKVLGGCCGTDERHVAALFTALAPIATAKDQP